MGYFNPPWMTPQYGGPGGGYGGGYGGYPPYMQPPYRGQPAPYAGPNAAGVEPPYGGYPYPTGPRPQQMPATAAGEQPGQQPGEDGPGEREPFDPFAETGLGQLLRQLSLNYARSPFSSMWPDFMMEVPGQQRPQVLGIARQMLPFNPMMMGPRSHVAPIGAGQGYAPGQPSQQPAQQNEVLHRFGPLENSMRTQMMRMLLGSAPYIDKLGPGYNLQYRGPNSRGRGPTRTTNTPAMYPELWDPYQGLYQWFGGQWAPARGGP